MATRKYIRQIKNYKLSVWYIMEGHLYIIHLREFVNLQSPVYKVGRTSDILRRYSQYPKHSRLLYLLPCTDCVKYEKLVLDSLRCSHIKTRIDIGSEYFEGDLLDIISIMSRVVSNKRVYSVSKSTQTDDNPFCVNPFEKYRYKNK